MAIPQTSAAIGVDPPTMRRLAFIRLLYLQAIDQCQLPEPLVYTSVLTFHDAAELFLVLAVDHLQASLPSGREPRFLDYWSILRPTSSFPGGVEISGRQGMDRLNRYRNALKHTGAWPGSDAVQDARSSVTSFLEENTPRVFGIEFDSIDMVDVVPQEDVRTRLKAAARAEDAGERTEAMAQLYQAFNELLRPHVGHGFSTFGFGNTVDEQPLVSISSMIQAVSSGARPQDRRNAQSIAQNLDRQLKAITKAVSAMQEAMRVMAIGIDYAQYLRFQQLTPVAWEFTDQRTVQTPPGYAPTRGEYEDCLQFVISVALRTTEVEMHTARPSWRAT